MKVYSSYELRWFSERPFVGIEEFFSDLGSKIDENAGRTDRYLKNNKDSFSIKFREGRLEMKLRGNKGENIRKLGTPSFWTKWSYELKDNTDPGEAMSEKDFIDVRKDRTLLYSEAGSSTLRLQTAANAACQHEYGIVTINGRRFYTFGLESFGLQHQLHTELEHALSLISPVVSELAGIEPTDYPDLLASLS